MSTLVEATRIVVVLPFNGVAVYLISFYGVAGYLTLMEALMPFNKLWITKNYSALLHRLRSPLLEDRFYCRIYSISLYTL